MNMEHTKFVNAELGKISSFIGEYKKGVLKILNVTSCGFNYTFCGSIRVLITALFWALRSL
jgi:hypothetical protein